MRTHARTLLHTLVIAVAAAWVAGCTSMTAEDSMRLPTQYATLKLIEQSGDVTATGVLRYVDLARTLVDQDITINAHALAAEILLALQAETLAPSDRFLIVALVQQIEIEAESLNLIRPDTRMSLLEILTWIEQAARMAG